MPPTSEAREAFYLYFYVCSSFRPATRDKSREADTSSLGGFKRSPTRAGNCAPADDALWPHLVSLNGGSQRTLCGPFQPNQRREQVTRLRASLGPRPSSRSRDTRTSPDWLERLVSLQRDPWYKVKRRIEPPCRAREGSSHSAVRATLWQRFRASRPRLHCGWDTGRKRDIRTPRPSSGARKRPDTRAGR